MQDTTSMIIEQSNRQRTKSDGPEPVVLWRQSDRLALQGLADIDGVPLPSDLAVAAHLPHCDPDLVLRGGYPTRVRPKRGTIPAGWRLLSQRLMWPILVVSMSKGVKGSLLPPGRRPRWTGGLRLQRPVQPFQASVLLRVTGFDTLRYDAQLDPPYRQRRQATQANAGEGRSVVRPDGRWKSVLPEGTLHDPTHMRASGARQPIADQQVPRGGVLQCEWVDPNPVPSAEPTLEVDGPDVVGALRSCKRLTPRRSTLPPFPTTYKPCTVEDVPCGAGRRPTTLWLHGSQPRHQLLRPPRWTLPPGRNKPLSHWTWRRIGMTTRSSTTVTQFLPAKGLEPVDPLVARLATDAELPAQLHECHFPSLPPLDKAHLLSFWARLFPRQHTPPDGFPPSSRNVLPMCPVYLLPMYPVYTHLYPLPSKGEERSQRPSR